MFVVTADQIDSRHRPDLADDAIAGVTALIEESLALRGDRTAGDEIQFIVTSAEAALSAILLLTRAGNWSVGCGIGAVSLPLGPSTRESTGPAFFAARDAVDAAKKHDTRFGVRVDTEIGLHSPHELDERCSDVGALIDLVLHQRARRSPEGWELYDLMVDGMTQAAAASTVGITPQAASKRARVAGIRSEFRAVAALGRMLGALEEATVEAAAAD